MQFSTTNNQVQLQLFYTKAAGSKVAFKVMWKKKKEIFDNKIFVGFSDETEIKETTGGFTTRAGVEQFVLHIKKHLKSYAGWYKIIELK